MYLSLVLQVAKTQSSETTELAHVVNNQGSAAPNRPTQALQALQVASALQVQVPASTKRTVGGKLVSRPAWIKMLGGC